MSIRIKMLMMIMKITKKMKMNIWIMKTNLRI
jgi:hypothetical protein